MSQRITLKLKNEVIARARDAALRSRRPVEDVLAEWLDAYASDLPVESLTDEQIVELCNFQMNVVQQQELSALLYHHRERDLNPAEQIRLDELLQLHRQGLVRKARALQVAKVRGLNPFRNNH